MPRTLWVWVFAALTFSSPAFALSTKSIADGLTADEVAATVSGPGAAITNVKITGSASAIGTFAEGGLGVDSGIILSSGNIADAVGPNDSPGAGAALGSPGDTQLNAIVNAAGSTNPTSTHDAVILEFDVVTKTPVFMIHYVFASEEYREYVDKGFNDVFAFFVDGANIATTPGSTDPVTINTINHLRNTQLYLDNETGTATQFDGYTVPMTAVAYVTPQVSHHIKIAVADAGDSILDSAVFIESGGITGVTAPVIVPPVSMIEGRLDQPTELEIPIYFVFEDIPYTLEAFGIPGATTTFSPVHVGPDGKNYVTMKMTLSADTPQGALPLTIRSSTADAENFTTIMVVIDCRPPAMLGTGQPVSQSVASGAPATLTVTPFGSAPYTYQWYSGFAGMTGSPILGANRSTFTTGAVTQPGSYWVRVTNACGSIDSLTAYVTPQ